jgi:hypothetical protein
MKSRYVLFLTMAIIITLLFTIMHSRAAFAAEEPEGLVGRWRLEGDANDSSGKLI